MRLLPIPRRTKDASSRPLEELLTVSAGFWRLNTEAIMLFFGRHGWRGESGRTYSFQSVLTKSGIPGDSGGIYVFVRRRFAFFLTPLYVGKAANLRERLLGHEKWGEAWWIRGATERHVLRVRTESERRMIEEDLIRGLRPPMNDIMMPRSEEDAPRTAALRRQWLWRRKVEAWLASLWKPLTGSRNTERTASRG